MKTKNDGLDVVIKHCRSLATSNKDLKSSPLVSRDNTLIIRLMIKKSHRFDVLIPPNYSEEGITVVQRRRNNKVVVVADYKYVKESKHMATTPEDIIKMIDNIIQTHMDDDVITVPEPVWVEYNPETDLINNEVFFGKVVEVKSLNNGELESNSHYLYQIKLQTRTGVWSKVISIYKEIHPILNSYMLFDNNNYCTFVHNKPL